MKKALIGELLFITLSLLGMLWFGQSAPPRTGILLAICHVPIEIYVWYKLRAFSQVNFVILSTIVLQALLATWSYFIASLSYQYQAGVASSPAGVIISATGIDSSLLNSSSGIEEEITWIVSSISLVVYTIAVAKALYFIWLISTSISGEILHKEREEVFSQAWSGLPKERQWAIASLLERSADLKQRSNSVLFFIIGLIVTGMVTFYFIGSIVSADDRRSPPIEYVNTTLLEMNRRLSSLETSLDQYQRQQARIRGRLEEDGVDFDLGNKTCSRSEGRCSEEDIEALYQLEALGVSVQETESELNTNRQLLQVFMDGVSGNFTKVIPQISGSNSADVPLLVASGLTRFGLLFITIYLVQILVGIYRYCLRLSEFYRSRAEALVLSPPDSDDLGKWADVLYGSTIDFGKMPSDPASNILSMFRIWRSQEDRKAATDNKEATTSG